MTVQKRVYKIPKYFECPFCGRKDGIKVNISQKDKLATLQCRSCGRGEPEPIPITNLTEPIDVYDDFMDRTRDSNIDYNAQPIDRDSSSDDDGNKPSDSDYIEYDHTKMSKNNDNSDNNDSGSDLDSDNSDKSDSDLDDSDKSDSD